MWTGSVDVGLGPRQRGNVGWSPSPHHEAGARARTIREASWGRAEEPRGNRRMGVGCGNVRPGSGRLLLSPVLGGDLGASLVGPGLEPRGPRLGRRAPPSHPALGAQQGAPLRLGLGSRLRRLRTALSPMARPRRLPPPGQRPLRPPRRLPPPPRAMEPSSPRGQGGAGRPGRPTDPRTDGPQRRRLPPALRRLGGAGPAGAPARAPPRPPPPARPHPPRAPDARPCRPPSAAEQGDRGGTGPGREGRHRSGLSKDGVSVKSITEKCWVGARAQPERILDIRADWGGQVRNLSTH